MYGQFSFLTLNKKSDWECGHGENIAFTAQGLSVMTGHKYSLWQTVLQSEMGIINPIISLSSSPSGLLFILDEAANIWTYDYINHQTTLLLKAGHGLFTAANCLAAAPNTLYLLISDPAAIIAISVSNGQILWSSNNFHGGNPLAILVSNNDELLVITAHAASPADAANQDSPGRTPMAVLKVTPAGLVKVLAQPPSFCLSETNNFSPGDRVKSALGKDGQLYVLDGPSGEFWIFSPDGHLTGHRKLGINNQLLAGLGVDSDETLYTAVTDGQPATAGKEQLLLSFSAGEQEAAPLFAYRGHMDHFWADHCNRIYIWNKHNSSLSILERQQNIKLDSSGKTRGTFVFPVLDSTMPELEWHRIVLNADIPDDTQIRLSYFSSDHKELVVHEQLLDMELYWREESTSLAEKLNFTASLWSPELVNPRDALLPKARGRYLYLKIELIGSETSTPLLRSVRIYYPRMSLLSYLPSVYQENPVSRDFLERFLSILGTFLQDMEEQIDQVYRIFDPQAVTGPFLSWLAGWLDLSIDENWSEEQVRRLMIAAPSLYKKRGTRAGMEEIIAIYTGEKPLIVEYFQFKYLQDISPIKQIMSRLYSQDPYCFTVLVQQDKVAASAQLATLQRIIEEEKPAFTEAKLVILQPWIYMDMHSYLGINTYLSELSLLTLDNKSAMPFNSLIIDNERDNRFDIHSRMELDAHLK